MIFEGRLSARTSMRTNPAPEITAKRPPTEAALFAFRRMARNLSVNIARHAAKVSS
jgi:hypothetical protein